MKVTYRHLKFPIYLKYPLLYNNIHVYLAYSCFSCKTQICIAVSQSKKNIMSWSVKAYYAREVNKRTLFAFVPNDVEHLDSFQVEAYGVSSHIRCKLFYLTIVIKL